MDSGPSCPRFDDDYREEHKACAVDDDCEAVAVQTSCTGTQRVSGVALEQREAFDACAPTADSFRSCRGPASPTRAEDGRSTAKQDLSEVHARCVAGMCLTRIEERACGSKVCNGNELCVSLQASTGAVEYDCVANPCTGTLDCDCAEPVCKLRNDLPRTCAVAEVADSDVFCKQVRR